MAIRNQRVARGGSRTGAQQRFATIPSAQIPRSVFNRSCGLKTTFNAGYLVPIFVDEALPGDTFNLKVNTFGRLATPLHPVMDNLYLDLFFFAVPNRLLWDNWKRFMGEETNPGDTTDFLIPQLGTPVGGHLDSSLADYMGIPTHVDPVTPCSAMWHRAYNLIWAEWFRDENLQNIPPLQKGNGPDSAAFYTLLRRGKRHDYFSSSLPFPQKGDPVELPLGSFAPVTGLGKENQTFQDTNQTVWESGGTQLETYAASAHIQGAAGNAEHFHIEEDPNNPGFPGIYADLSNATAATINEIRQAFQVQKLLERDARGGTRYTEMIRSHFGVTSPDARQQRPEYLGGASQNIMINPVAVTGENTEVTGNATPTLLGELAGYGTVAGRSRGFVKSFTEHCVILGLASVRADLTYQQGLNRMFSRESRFDFYFPALAHLGEQAVISREIFMDGSGDKDLGTGDHEVFGYQERFAEYRYKPSQITGEFRSNTPLGPLDTWHLAQDFGATRPLLNEAFIMEDPPIDRIIAIVDEPHLLLDCFFQFKCVRPMPTYSVPGLVDHF